MKSVLFVEDDAGLRLELTDYLSNLGYTPRGTDTLAKAEHELQKGCAVLLLDINLPDGSGLDFCTRMRPYVRSGIVMLTGRSERELRLQALRGGADAYLVKPVDPEELEATLFSVMRRRDDSRLSILRPPPLPVQWRLDSVRLSLLAPNGLLCKLSKQEAVLLCALLQAPKQQIARSDLLAAFEVQGLPSNGHRVEALISRLRSKVATDTKLELPVQSVYRQGYAFLDHAKVL
jgi:DNA-binding response OmpR family regulator